MRYYPLFIDLTAKDVLVVGAGTTGMRKIHTLLQASPRFLHIVDPKPMPEALTEYVASGTVHYDERPFRASDIQGKHLVFAATDATTVNSFIADMCEANNTLCNIVDSPKQSDFLVPALVRQGPISLAISTQGASPALARHLRGELEAWLKNRYTHLAVLLKRLRPLVLPLTGQDKAALFTALVQSPLAEHLCREEWDMARDLLAQLLPAELHSSIGELLHDL